LTLLVVVNHLATNGPVDNDREIQSLKIVASQDHILRQLSAEVLRIASRNAVVSRR
jgi:hypothetical protein